MAGSCGRLCRLPYLGRVSPRDLEGCRCRSQQGGRLPLVELPRFVRRFASCWRRALLVPKAKVGMGCLGIWWVGTYAFLFRLIALACEGKSVLTAIVCPTSQMELTAASLLAFESGLAKLALLVSRRR